MLPNDKTQTYKYLSHSNLFIIQDPLHYSFGQNASIMAWLFIWPKTLQLRQNDIFGQKSFNYDVNWIKNCLLNICFVVTFGCWMFDIKILFWMEHLETYSGARGRGGHFIFFTTYEWGLWMRIFHRLNSLAVAINLWIILLSKFWLYLSSIKRSPKIFWSYCKTP